MARDDLIAKYIEPDRYHPGPATARLKHSGFSVWVVVAEMLATARNAGRDIEQVTQRDLEEVANGFGIPQEAVCAVREYYTQHQAAIDTHLAALVA